MRADEYCHSVLVISTLNMSSTTTQTPFPPRSPNLFLSNETEVTEHSSPIRSASLRRKPVPELLNLGTINTSLPPSHPFASASSPGGFNHNNNNGGISPRNSSLPGSGRSSPAPALWSEEVSYAPRSIPPPHRRTVSGLGIAGLSNASSSPAQSLKSVTGVDYDAAPAPPLPEERKVSLASLGHGSITSEVDLFDILNATPRNSRGPTFSSSGSTRSMNLSVDHPLPPLPDHRSMVSSDYPMPVTPDSQLTPTATHHASWGLDQELDVLETSGKSKKEEQEKEEFSVDRLPSKRNLWEAGTCFVRDEEGKLVCFGDFFPRRGGDVPGELPKIRKTVVFFIRYVVLLVPDPGMLIDHAIDE